MRVCWLCCIIFTKRSRGTSSEHWYFQSLNNYTRIGYQRLSMLMKKKLVRRKWVVAVRLLGLNFRFSKSKQAFDVVLAVFPSRYLHKFIMQPTRLLQRAAAKATSKTLRFSFLENHGMRQGLTEKFILGFSTTLA